MCDDNQQPQSQPADPKDLSTHAISLARAIDRLPDGEYIIRIVKPSGDRWKSEINEINFVRELWK